jgi:hypothetical protein
LSAIVIPFDITNPNIVQHWGRSRGPFLQAEFNGAVMVMLLPVALYLANTRRGFFQFLGAVTGALLCVGCYLTETRAVLLTLTLVLFTGAICRGPQRQIYIIFITLIFLVSLARYLFGASIVPRLNEIGPISDRLKLISVTFKMIFQHPIIGIGYGNFDLFQEDFFDPTAKIVATFTEGNFWSGGTHNTLLTPFAELGILIGGLLLFLILRVVIVGFIYSRNSVIVGKNADSQLVLCSTLICMAFILNAFFVELRYTLTPNALFWVFAGIIESCKFTSKKRAKKID